MQTEQINVDQRLAEIESELTSGTGDTAALARERRELLDRREALKTRALAEKQAAYREQGQARARANREAVTKDALEVANLVPKALYALVGLVEKEATLFDAIGGPGERVSWQDVTGLPPGAAKAMLEAIQQAAPVNWDYSCLDGKASCLPTPRQGPTIHFAHRPQPWRLEDGPIPENWPAA